MISLRRHSSSPKTRTHWQVQNTLASSGISIFTKRVEYNAQQDYYFIRTRNSAWYYKHNSNASLAETSQQQNRRTSSLLSHSHETGLQIEGWSWLGVPLACKVRGPIPLTISATRKRSKGVDISALAGGRWSMQSGALHLREAMETHGHVFK